MSRIETLERATAAGFRHGRRLSIGPWWCLASPVAARRANSCYAIGDPGEPLDHAVARVEGFYAGLDQPVVFKLTERAPEALDERLDRAGYRHVDVTSVLWLPRGRWPEEVPSIAVTPAPTRDWLRDVRRGSSSSEVRRFIATVTPPGVDVAFATGPDGVARGMAAVVDGWLMVSNMFTSPEARRRGWGTAVLRALLAWGRNRAEHGAMLQVADANAPATALYRAQGFGLSHRYWYRARPCPSGHGRESA